MTTKQTNEVTDKMINTVEVEGVKLFVSNVGQIYDQNGKEIRQQTITNKQTGYTNPYKFISLKIGKGKFKRVQVSRLVCMAFHPVDNPDEMQVDHINNDPTDNRSSNLRFVSRKANNSKKHTRQMKSMNAVHTNHADELIKATNISTGEVRYFKNGREAAKGLSCSHVLIYNAIQGRITTTAKGWKVCWVARDADEGARKFTEELEQKKEQKLREMMEAKLKVKLARQELKRKMRESVKELQRAQLKSMRETMREEMRQLKEEQRKRTWERHAILQYGLDGSFIREWDTVAEAIRETGITTIAFCLKGNQKHAGGYVWKFKSETTNN